MSDATPLMSQYRDIKAQYSDCILLFRVGDFYETFYDDAVDVSSVLNIALTSRDRNKANPVPLAGVPFHAAETYITRLLAAGRRVAVCEQVEDPALAKGLVRREVVEVLTPGTAISSQLIPDGENNYCMSIHATADGRRTSVALVDVSTGEFACGECPAEELHHLVQGKRVRELVHAESLDVHRVRSLAVALGEPVFAPLRDEVFTETSAERALTRQFGDGFDAGSLAGPARIAAGALLDHCYRLRNGVLPQIVRVDSMSPIPYLSLDDETIANLELFEPQRGGEAKATLVRTIDRTLTAAGSREIRRWLERPLCHVAAIEERLDAVACLYSDAARAEATVRALRGIGDLQRLTARIASRKAIPREIHALRESLEKVPELCAAMSEVPSTFLEQAREELGAYEDVTLRLASAIVDDPPGHIRDGGVIRRGFDAELDTSIDESEAARSWIAGLERRERERSGIGSLKVGYNRVFGYYLEVSKANASAVPADYIQKQTLVNAQRYYTQELKEKEDRILSAEERRVKEEARVFDALCAEVAAMAARIQTTAAAVARIDVAQSLAVTARLYGYRRPVIDDSSQLQVVAGRHPVIERFGAEAFVPNDLDLDPERRQFGLITGPNMSGKSTFLRQTALIVVMAQMGSFVPAERARIGLVDQVFTRVGASDRLSRGESTFLVEMNETATILRRMTDRSLVVLDEIGRGTSTYDGLSIAWAVTEYILQGIRARPRTLFATHFHELTQLRSAYPRLLNLKITIREWEGGIIFLRKIVPGTSDRSFGIHAARVAGIPDMVLRRAEEILASLELRRSLLTEGVEIGEERAQFGLFDAPASPGASAVDAEIRAAVEGFDADRSTPLAAFDLLRRLKDRIR